MAVSPTPRQRLIERIIRKSVLEAAPLAFDGTAGLRSAVDSAGFTRSIAADGKDQVPAHEAAQLLAQAIESAVVSSQPQLVRAIYTAERDRSIALLNGQSSTYTTNKGTNDAEVAAITGTVLS